METIPQLILIYVIVLVTGSTSQFLDKKPWPHYSLHNMPKTSFTCRDKILGGYYADAETQCQMFHVCVKVAGVGVQDFRFLCPNGTAFDQEAQTCADWGDVDCEQATLYYGSDNFDLYRLGSGFESKRAPFADEDEAPFHLQRAETADIRRSKQTVVNQSTSPDKISFYHGTPKPASFQANQPSIQSRSDASYEQKKPTTLATRPVTNFVNSYKPSISHETTATYRPTTKFVPSNGPTDQEDKDNDEIFKGSHSSNFFNNRNNGKDEDLEEVRIRKPVHSRPFRGRQRGRTQYDNSNIIQSNTNKNRQTTESVSSRVNTAKAVPNTTTQAPFVNTYNTARPQQNVKAVNDTLSSNTSTYYKPTPTSTTTSKAPELYNPYQTYSHNQNKESTVQFANNKNTNFNGESSQTSTPSNTDYQLSSNSPIVPLINRQQRPLQDPFKVTYNLDQQNNNNPVAQTTSSPSTFYSSTSTAPLILSSGPQSFQPFGNNVPKQQFYNEPLFNQRIPTFSNEQQVYKRPINASTEASHFKQPNGNYQRQNNNNNQPLINFNNQQFSVGPSTDFLNKPKEANSQLQPKYNQPSNNGFPFQKEQVLNNQTSANNQPSQFSANKTLSDQSLKIRNHGRNTDQFANVRNRQSGSLKENRPIPAAHVEPNPTTYNPRQNTKQDYSARPVQQQHQSTTVQANTQAQNKYQTINRITENYTPSTIKRFSTLVPKDQYNPTTFKPSTLKLIPEPFSLNPQTQQQKQQPSPQLVNIKNPFAYPSTASTTTSTTTKSIPIDDVNEDDGQYHPELYEKDFYKNKLQQKLSTTNFNNYQRQSHRQQPSTPIQNPANNNYQISTDATVGAFESKTNDDEFLDTAHSQNIAVSGNELRIANAKKNASPKPFSKSTTDQTLKPTKSQTPKFIQKTTRKPPPIAAGKNNNKDDTYDYAYYDLTNDNHSEYSEYEIKDFGKTRKSLKI